jgi:superfamily I DNA and/or RNA helicase
MAPQFYFQKKSTQSSDLLHQASFYWENTMLTNHYRSENADLIAFSNRYFYQNKLKPYPSPNQNKAIEVIQAKGQFVDRKNEEEARIVADLVAEKLKKGEKDFGLVAFSQTQLIAILDKLSADHQNLLLDEEADYFVQSLENVQGDQCNHLIISMGYAPNEDGDFHMRFGPLNQEQGHRRLNVLMSRAKSKITFVRSVKAEDFPISDNDGVELLRKLMLFLEEDHDDRNQQLGDHISLDVSKNKLTIRQPQNAFQSSVGLVNFYNVMVSRGWGVEFFV